MRHDDPVEGIARPLDVTRREQRVGEARILDLQPDRIEQALRDKALVCVQLYRDMGIQENHGRRLS